jgi:hypothetical protein
MKRYKTLGTSVEVSVCRLFEEMSIDFGFTAPEMLSYLAHVCLAHYLKNREKDENVDFITFLTTIGPGQIEKDLRRANRRLIEKALDLEAIERLPS